VTSKLHFIILTLILNLFAPSAKGFDSSTSQEVFQPPFELSQPYHRWSEFETWQQISTEHLVFIFPKSLNYTAVYIRQHASQFDRMYKNLKQFFPLMPNPVPVFIEYRAISHNGSASSLPSPRIIVYNTPPDYSQDLGKSNNYLAETIRHELAHIAHFSAKSDFYNALSSIFGEIVNPAGISPRWLLEGFAVWAETVGSTVGRGRSTFEQGWAELFVPKWPDLGDLNGPRIAYPRGNTGYLFGYLFFEYLEQTYGYEKVLTFIQKTGHTVPSIYATHVKTIFGKSLSHLWEDAESFYLKQIRLPSTKAHKIIPITAPSSEAYYRGTAAILNHEAFYWESHPYEGSRLIRQQLSPPYLRHIGKRLTPPQANHATLTSCEGSLYGTEHHPSQSGAAPALVKWNLASLTKTNLKINLAPYGKVLDIACTRYKNHPAIAILMFWDMGHHLLVYQDNKLHSLGFLPYQSKNVFPVQLIDHPKHLQLLMRRSDTLANEVWILSNPPKKYAFPWSHRRHIHKITFDPTENFYWATVSAKHGRNILKLDSQLNLLGEFDVSSPLPLEIQPYTKKHLLLSHVDATGTSYAMLKKPRYVQSFNSKTEPLVPHPNPKPLPIFDDELNDVTPAKSPSALLKNSVSEPYDMSPYLFPKYWQPMLVLSSLKNPTFGFNTSALDITETFGYRVQVLTEANPFAIGISNILQWRNTLVTHGPLLSYQYAPSGSGLEVITSQFTSGWIWSRSLDNGVGLFISANYSPGFNKNHDWRHLISVPIVFQYSNTWGNVIYPYGWSIGLELEGIGGTLFNFNGARLLNGDTEDPGVTREWHADLKPSAQLKAAFPLFSSTSGIYQSLQYIFHEWTSKGLGPVDFEIFRAKPFPTITHAASTPFNLTLISDSHHIVVHKLRPFFLLAQVDKGFGYLPLYLNDIWLEGIFDSGYFQSSTPWLGSFGLQLTANFSIFYHQRTSLRIAAYFPWIQTPSFDDFTTTISFNIPFPL
jgi:hypothetical protein